MNSKHKDDSIIDACQCPNCGGGLVSQTSQYQCADCRTMYLSHDNIPLFSDKKDYYYGEIKQNIFNDLIRLSQQKSTQQALNDFLDKGLITDFAYKYGTERNRGNFFLLLRPGKDKAALDLGCGWGNISLTLGKFFGTCYSIDLTPERVKFLKIRTTEEGLENIKCICGGDSKILPFKDNYFDCVVLNGILEWVPENYDHGDPQEIQLHYLKEVCRITKDSGQIYLAIENRYGLDYFQNEPDDHTGMMYTSILPRFLADYLSNRKRSKGYRTYTYSRYGYTEMLQKAGYNDVSFHIPYPDYRRYETIISQDVSKYFLQYIKRCCYAPTARTKARAFLLPYMSNSYSIVANKEKSAKQSWLQSFYAEICKRYCKEFGSLTFPEYINTPTSGIGLLFKNKSSNGLFVSIPSDRLSAKNNLRQFENLQVFHGLFLGTDAVSLASRPMNRGEFNSVQYYVYCLIDNVETDDSSYKGETVRKLCRYFITKSIESNELPENIELINIFKVVDSLSIQIDKDAFSQKMSKLQSMAGSTRLPMHGDLWPGNVKSDRSGQSFVIDWTDFQKNGLPLFDLFHFYLFPESFGNKGCFAHLIKQSITTFSQPAWQSLNETVHALYIENALQNFTPERVSALFMFYLLENITRRIIDGFNLKNELVETINLITKGPFPLPALTGENNIAG